MSLLKIPLAAVIGCPIAHSKSPRLHGHWLYRYQIPGHYVPLDVTPDDFANVLRTLPRMGFVGANVTLPHKEAALAIADEVSATAEAIGAANTLTFAETGAIQADNTDGFGFIENIRQSAPNWTASNGEALVLGAGGAARAVVHALKTADAGKIWLSNRTQARADELADAFGAPVSVIPWSQAADLFSTVTTVVNTTSLGMAGKPEFDLPFDLLSPDALVNDLVYVPLETKLLRMARERGCQTVDGLGMLLHQAAPGFSRWFGVDPKVDDDLRQVMLA